MPFFSSGKNKDVPANTSTFASLYTVNELLGKGAFSEVKRVTRIRDSQQFAAKMIDRKKIKGKESSLQNEITILKTIRHKNIVNLIDCFEDDKKIIVLILSLVTGGELFDRIIDKGYYSERDAIECVKQILSAVGYLHSQGIAHRDLKPENLLLLDDTDDAPIILTDFGLSAFLTDKVAMRTACGTPGYVAPEVLAQRPYDEKVDMWSIGVITYILLCGYPPFYSEDDEDEELFNQILRCQYEFHEPFWQTISDAGKAFISSLITLDAGSRPSCEEILQHEWICTDEASHNVNIYSVVSENLRKYIVKRRWKKAFNATTAIRRMKISPSNSSKVDVANDVQNLNIKD